MINSSAMTFGDKVLQLRLKRGWSQRELGLAVGGITASSISAWEAKGTIPALDVAFRTAKVLGVSLTYLADENLDTEPISDQVALSELTVRQQMLLAAMEAFGFEETWRRLHPTPPEGFKPRYNETVGEDVPWTKKDV